MKKMTFWKKTENTEIKEGNHILYNYNRCKSKNRGTSEEHSRVFWVKYS